MPASPAETVLYILTALLILVLPGAACLAWFPQRRGLLAWLADSVGLSVSLTAVIALAGFLLDVQFTRPLVGGLYFACGLLLITGLLHRLLRGDRPAWNMRQAGLELAGLVAVIGLAAWRLYQARDLVLPAWVDSVHHTLVVRVILEQGGLPQTLSPYLPVVFSYHYGFHVLAALFAGLAQIEPAAAVLWFGQILNAAIALAVYRLALEVWDDRRRALLAFLLVGFGFQMPAYYLAWGRYTLITGLVVLPLAMTALVRISRTPRRFSAWLAVVILTAGVALAHLTALLLLGFFTAILLLLRLVEPRLPEEAGGSRWQQIWPVAAAALSGVLVAAPWLWRTWQQVHAMAGVSLVSPVNSDQQGYWNYILYLLGPTHSAIWLAVGGAGLIWALLLRPGRPLAIWGLLLALLTLPWGLRLGPWRPDHMAIVLFLPGALLAADFVFNLAGRISRLGFAWLRRALNAVLGLACMAGLVYGSWQMRNVLNPATIFVNQADVAALDWVRAHTPPDARFLINTAPWMGRTFRGVDGGYWLLPYAGRQTILPPALYTYGQPDHIAQVEDLAQRAAKLTTCDADFWSVVQEYGATHIYLRQGQGSLQAQALAGCPRIVNVYRSGGVFLYEIAP